MVKNKRAKKNKFKKSKSVKGQGKVKLLSLVSGSPVRWVSYLAGALFLMFLCIFIHDFLTQTHYFDIKSVEISGNNRLNTEEIKIQGNVDTGMNILSINLGILRKKLIAHPWIASADITRVLPYNITISIIEEKPLALISFDKPHLVNREGLIFKELNKSDEKFKLNSLPVINGLKPADFQNFSKADNRYLLSALEIIRLGEHSELLPVNSIGKLHVDKDLGVTLTLIDLLKIQSKNKKKFSVLKIKLGFEDYQLKYSRLNKVLLKLATFKENDVKNYQKIDLIDLSNTGRVIVKVSEV